MKAFKYFLTTILTLFALLAFCQNKGDSVRITLTANNLSEDKSLLSTKNDEIIVQVYRASKDSILEAPIIYKDLIFDEAHRVKAINLNIGRRDTATAYFLYLTEYEYDKSYEQRTPVYRIYHQAINQAFEAKDVKALRKYLNTDDLLGFKRIEIGNESLPMNFTFEGIQNLERYAYTIQIE